MEQLDANGDGLLSDAELKGAPGLKYCLPELDVNGDGQLSKEEIAARITLYRDLRIGMVGFLCRVTMNGRPLPGASVRMVPEPFLGDIVTPAQGTTNRDGLVDMIIEGEDVPAVRIGMYRVEITSARGKVPARFNTETELGVEVSPVTEESRPGIPEFKLRSS